MTKPVPRTYPFTNSFSGGNLSQIRGVTEHYHPAKYDNLECLIKFFKVEIKNFRQMEVSFSFLINGPEDVIQNLYEGENWKFMRTDNLLERFPKQSKLFFAPAPLFSLMLNKYLQVVGVDLFRSGKKVEVVYDADADILLMPSSFPPLTEMPGDENYVYYNKKSSVFYSDLCFGEKYEARILLEANAATFEFAPLFPFGRVLFEKISVVSSGEYDIEPIAWRVKPETTKVFPEWFQYQLDKLESYEPRMPRFRPALPYRGTFPLFNLEQELKSAFDGASKEEILKIIKKKEADISKPIQLGDYETLRFGFGILIPEDKNIDVIVRTIQRSLPSRIYEQIQKLPNYRDVLVEYDIFNLSKNKLRLRVETEICGYSEKETKTIFIHGIHNQKEQKARNILAQCPRLKKDVLENLAVPVKATMLCRVIDEDRKEVLFEENFNVDILANDEMVWELQDLRSNQTYNLRDFVCAWITPTDKKGLLDKVRSGARAFHPDNALGHKLNTLGDLIAHVRALYDYLAKNGMTYLNQPFSSKTSMGSQRVILPERVLENNAGNCIDLTVLFSSLLEGFGVYSLIFLTPTHAFIGWGDKSDKDKMVFLETTLLGYADFDTAMARGREVFEDNFLMNGGPTPVFMPDLRRINGNFIVDTRDARHSGFMSVRKG